MCVGEAASCVPQTPYVGVRRDFRASVALAHEAPQAIAQLVQRDLAQPAAEAGLVDEAVLRQRDVWAANLVTFLVSAGQSTMFFLIPQAVQLARAHGAIVE